MSDPYLLGEWGDWTQDDIIKLWEPECSCGTKITMGADDHPMFHSDWCKVREDYENKQNKPKRP